MQKAGMHFDAVLKGYLVDKNTNKREDKICYSIERDKNVTEMGIERHKER